MRDINYDSVPVDYMAGGLKRYVEHGMEPGSFMQAILCNDLMGAVSRADATNIQLIPAWCKWIHANLPGICYGSEERYEAWVTKQGLAFHNG